MLVDCICFCSWNSADIALNIFEGSDAYTQDMCDAHCFQQLHARGMIVAAKVEEAGKDF